MPLTEADLEPLRRSRYAMLRTYRRDGAPVDTPIWFVLENRTALFRTKIGPKTRRLLARPDVELVACDHRGRVRDAKTVTGRAAVLSGEDAQRANRALHHRYGWQWNIVPLLKIPGVTNVHRDLPLREKLRRARSRGLWPDSAIVRIDLDPQAPPQHGN